MIVHAVVDDSSSPAHVLGEAVDVLVRRAGAERFIGEVRGDEPELARFLRIEERELEAGGRVARISTLSQHSVKG